MKKSITPPPIRALSVFLLLAVILAQAILPFNVANAAQITTRRLTLQASDDGLTGGSKPGGVVKHFFEFTVPSTSAIGSIQFQYCTTPADVGALTCTPPTGLDTSTATLGSSSGVTGLTITNSPTSVVLARASTFTPAANTPVTVLLKGVKNPTTKNQTFFARISTYASLDGSGSPTDTGSVAAATADPILLSGVMPESLVFCTGATVGLDLATSTVPDCSTATAGTIAFNQLFSPTDTAVANSQMAASTNAGFGYAITVNGPTLTSGSNTVAGMASAGASVRGTPQFGMNLMANTSAVAAGFPGASKDPAPLANATNFKGEAANGYKTADTFKYVSGDVVADSYNGYVPGTNTAATDAQIFTVSYIANVPGSQPAGTYATTLTYICTPTY
jgi:hypothetical protein